jgi:hypothetical protein
MGPSRVQVRLLSRERSRAGQAKLGRVAPSRIEAVLLGVPLTL